MRVLILGGTTEASALARSVAERGDIGAILSLAGRTASPALPPVPHRIGGFGGVDGLASFLREECIDAIVDATHPFATRISAHAGRAAALTGCPLAVFSRPAWSARAGDDWRSVPHLDAAASALGARARKVFLTSGRLGLSAFKAAPHHCYILRSIDPPAPEDCPPLCDILLARGPFDVASEEALMRRQGIEILVTKNSGGAAGAAKLDAARALRLPVVLVERPAITGDAPRITSLDGILAWIADQGRALSGKTP